MKILLILVLACCAGAQTSPDLLKDVTNRPPITLEEFQQYARAANPALKRADALTRRSAALARQAGLYPNPSVGYQGEQIRGGSYDGGEQGAFVQQTIVLGGKLGLRRDVYREEQRGNEIGSTLQRYRVTADVARAFYAALAVQETVAVQKRLLAVAEQAVDTAHKLANVGQADAPDVLQAQVEAEQARIDYMQAERGFIAAFYTLIAIVGKPELPLSPLKGDFEHPPQIDAQQLAEQIVQESPLAHEARQNVVRAETALKSARREAVPDLQIHAGLQQNFEPINLNPRSPVGLQGFATAGIDLPIFNRNQGNVAAARADLDIAQAEATRLQLLIRQQAQTLVQNYLTASEEAERYRTELIPQATRAYQLYLTKYEQMASAYPQVLISQRTSFQLQLSYIHALEQVWINAKALQNYALASGLASPETGALP